MSYTIGQMAALLGLECQGDSTRLLKKVAKRERADEFSLIFLQSRGKREFVSRIAASRLRTCSERECAGWNQRDFL